MTAIQQLVAPSCLNVMQKGYRQSRIIGASPFDWNKHEKYPETLQSPSRTVLWWINMLLSFTQAGFALVQYWRTIRNDTKTAANKIYIHFSAVLYSLCVLLQLSNFSNRRCLPRFVKGCINFFEDLRGKCLFQLSF